MAIAVAQERLLATHIDHVLDLIELVGDQVPFDDALEIYNRLLRLPDDEARVITTRALAILGERDDNPRSWPERMADADLTGGGEAPRRSLLGHLRQRLRGRINEELRRWIELEAARTEVALLDAHVENALSFVEILEHEVPFTEAVELYLESLDLRDSVAEVAYYITLAKLHEKNMPGRPERKQARPAPKPASSRESTEARRLRVVSSEGD